MNTRKQGRRNQGLEPNLYKNGDYYRYRHPITGKFHGMGTDKTKANVAARKLNAILTANTDLAKRILANSSADTFGKLIDRYKNDYLPTKNLKQKTLQIVNYQLNRLDQDLSTSPLDGMTVHFISNYLDEGFKNNAYIKMRILMIDVFRYGRTKGLVNENPAEHTLKKTPDAKKRRAMTQRDFDLIYRQSPEWLQIAMDLALVTLQRRGDLCKMRYEDIREDCLYIIQQKTEKHGLRARLRIKMTDTLADIIHRSRADGIACPFVIHRRPYRIKRSNILEHWAQVRDELLSKEFAKYRDKVSTIAALPAEERPTFHEIRALGGHLYLQAGFDPEYVQTLMGHSTGKMTAHYTDRHEDWTECRADFSLKRN
ncbi:tyrosine-type recombinase/integrase [Oceanospirillum maris]|uniref:tyrosine-type recombinase/integrase n=1 Tax=Oceanospirillum maris TaxID=64977 RepID=UPI0003FB31FF|nr:tyrosine-type recombinase/integrase [Oceanospirillum maris]